MRAPVLGVLISRASWWPANEKYTPALVVAVAAQEINDIVTGCDIVCPEVADERTEGYAKLRVLEHQLRCAERDLESSDRRLANRATFEPVERPGESKRRRVAREKASEGADLKYQARRDFNYIRVSALQTEVAKRAAALVGIEDCPVKSTARVRPGDLAAACRNGV